MISLTILATGKNMQQNPAGAVFLTALLSSFLLIMSSCSQPNKDSIKIESDLEVMSGTDSGPTIEGGTNSLAMSFSELSECGKKIAQLNEGFSRLENEQRQHDKRKNEVAAQSQAIESARLKVNLKQARQVKDFNARLEQHRSIVKQFNTSVSQFNTQVAELKIQNESFNTACANRPYHHADFERLSNELKTTIKTYAQTTAGQTQNSGENENSNFTANKK